MKNKRKLKNISTHFDYFPLPNLFGEGKGLEGRGEWTTSIFSIFPSLMHFLQFHPNSLVSYSMPTPYLLCIPSTYNMGTTIIFQKACRIALHQANLMFLNNIVNYMFSYTKKRCFCEVTLQHFIYFKFTIHQVISKYLKKWRPWYIFKHYYIEFFSEKIKQLFAPLPPLKLLRTPSRLRIIQNFLPPRPK